MNRLSQDKIHFGLPEAQLRDTLSEMYERSDHALLNISSNRRYSLVTLEDAESMIADGQLAKKHILTMTGLASVFEQKGWTRHDISDQVYYNRDSYYSFLGTKEEYEIRIGERPYIYRNYSCEGRTLHIQGCDDESGSGVLEWCDNMEDAQYMLALMMPYPRFSNLSIGDL